MSVHCKAVTVCTSRMIAGQSNLSTSLVLSFQNKLVCQWMYYSSPLSSFKDLPSLLKSLWQKICLSSSLREEQLPKPSRQSPGPVMGFQSIKMTSLWSPLSRCLGGPESRIFTLFEREELRLASTCCWTLEWAEATNVMSWHWYS